MKIIVGLCLLAVALAVPVPQTDEYREPIRILRQEISPIEGPNFRYFYETENGITVEKEGRAGNEGQSVMTGYYTFPLPNGETVEIRYTADENGYVPESAHLPVAPPMPEHALQQIAFAAQQRAAGVEWDQQGFVI